jgi:hypothetical protein
VSGVYVVPPSIRKTPANIGVAGAPHRGCRTGCADASKVAGAGFEMVKNLQAPMGTIPATIGSAVALLMSPALAMAQTAQQDQTMTATASAPSRSDACTASTGKAYALCMARGFFNITSVNCDCNQRNAPGAPWECVATATCKK